MKDKRIEIESCMYCKGWTAVMSYNGCQKKQVTCMGCGACGPASDDEEWAIRFWNVIARKVRGNDDRRAGAGESRETLSAYDGGSGLTSYPHGEWRHTTGE